MHSWRVSSAFLDEFSVSHRAGGRRLGVGGTEVDACRSKPRSSPEGNCSWDWRPEHLDQGDGIGLEASVEFVEAIGLHR